MRPPRYKAPRGWLAALALAGLVGLAGCAPVGPDYSPPHAEAPPTWHSQLSDGVSPAHPEARTLARWWQKLGDPTLSALVKQAVAGNLALKQAQARVRQARALRGVTSAGLYPQVDAAGVAEWGRTSEATGTGSIDEYYAVGFDATWEVDIFGGVRRSVEAAQAQLEASQANLRDTLVSLVAEVALNYTEARTYQERLAVASANLKAQENTYSYISSRHEAGLVNRLALEQARYNLANTRSRIPSLRAGLDASLNRLAVLLGQTPGRLHALMAKPRPVPVPPASIAVGIPAQALRRRPDIRRAERNLAAQTARVGVATAELYPKFRLAGTIGLEGIKGSDLSTAGNLIWGILPSFSWNIFNAGAVRARIAAQEAVQEEAMLTYQATVLTALEEVENALTGYAQEQRRREALRQAVQAAKEAEGLSQDLFQAGLNNFDSVLDAQRSLLTFQDQLAISDGVVTARLISLYKALGGGWGAQPPAPAKPPRAARPASAP
ncbi:MAG: efflux transporter outer membrane subunit [Desulfarculaceae bacterium]|nr:efflux transporter outer membrane subunit [Desulfarculaceae bacterium]MCF8074290.1 efflux transporter outer membrane subunit [Desulfarculaceae bacterium]MCF8103358.1 efflux transporter outer membrane subunit [Desulfarculaceae bacterium]MCF8117852.1 efflux transporter outer membrane subunit [Desulfarculaceae bacterium]